MGSYGSVEEIVLLVSNIFDLINLHPFPIQSYIILILIRKSNDLFQFSIFIYNIFKFGFIREFVKFRLFKVYSHVNYFLFIFKLITCFKFF